MKQLHILLFLQVLCCFDIMLTMKNIDYEDKKIYYDALQNQDTLQKYLDSKQQYDQESLVAKMLELQMNCVQNFHNDSHILDIRQNINKHIFWKDVYKKIACCGFHHYVSDYSSIAQPSISDELIEKLVMNLWDNNFENNSFYRFNYL